MRTTLSLASRATVRRATSPRAVQWANSWLGTCAIAVTAKNSGNCATGPLLFDQAHANAKVAGRAIKLAIGKIDPALAGSGISIMDAFRFDD
jgi:hypothetical protein